MFIDLRLLTKRYERRSGFSENVALLLNERGVTANRLGLTICLRSPVEPTRTKVIQPFTLTNTNKPRDPPSILKINLALR